MEPIAEPSAPGGVGTAKEVKDEAPYLVEIEVCMKTWWRSTAEAVAMTLGEEVLIILHWYGIDRESLEVLASKQRFGAFRASLRFELTMSSDAATEFKQDVQVLLDSIKAKQDEVIGADVDVAPMTPPEPLCSLERLGLFVMTATPEEREALRSALTG